ncbi:MAG: peptidylprolyl isomerase, partial [Saccharofermentanales bacterium]
GLTGCKKEEKSDLLSGKHHVEMDIEGYGTVCMELDADTAPITVTNFINLANQGFYNGLTFHRIIAGFMAQGGDPLGTGRGGSGSNITGEFNINGIMNYISHNRGTVSMARSADSYNSGSSQFFICVADCTSLDGQYAAFGRVTSGMDVVDAMVEATPVQDDNGTVLSEDQPVITEIRVID